MPTGRKSRQVLANLRALPRSKPIRKLNGTMIFLKHFHKMKIMLVRPGNKADMTAIETVQLTPPPISLADKSLHLLPYHKVR